MNFLANAIGGIQVGGEDYENGSRSRLLASVRNVYAGILLVYTKKPSGRACGKREPAEELIPRAIADQLSYERYLAFKDGTELPYVSCPECSEDTYVISEKECANCGHEAIHTCMRCSLEIPPEELESSPLSGWCAHMPNKDDSLVKTLRHSECPVYHTIYSVCVVFVCQYIVALKCAESLNILKMGFMRRSQR